MSDLVVPRRNTNYTAEEIETGLHTLAMFSGNKRRASEFTKNVGRRISASTLERWKKDYPDRYLAICREVMPAIKARLAETSDELANEYAELERKAITQLSASLDELEPRDKASALRNFATARAISVDKALLLRGEATEIRETRNASQLLNDLARKFPNLVNVNPDVIEGKAEEIAA